MQKRKIDPSIFTGSIADITFLLIIYFMVTATFSATKGLDFAVPKEKQTDVIETEEAVDVHILPGGVFIIDKQQMPLDKLLDYIKPKLERNPNKPVIIRCDPEAEYKYLVDAFDELRQAPKKIGMEVKNISIPTQREMEVINATMGGVF